MASPGFGHDFSRIPLRSPAEVLQTKLAINQPGDVYEQEADRISEHVMRMSDPQVQRACACGGTCSECQAKQSGPQGELHRTSRLPADVAGDIAAPPIVEDVLRSPGQPLDATARAFFELRFGHDFSRVRLHTDAHAAESARNVNALAYTVGHNIAFATGQYAPGTGRGNRLLAHELTHVVQQTAGSGGGTMQRQQATTASTSNPDQADQGLITAAQNTKRDLGMRAVMLVWGILHNHFHGESSQLWVNVVFYDDAVAGLRTEQVGQGATAQGKIAVGKQFIDSITEATFEDHVAQVGGALKQIEEWRRPTPLPELCQPNRPLTWADFTGKPTGSFDAFTAFHHELATVQGEQVVRAVLDPARCFAEPRLKNPADRVHSGCDAAIKQCETLLAGKTGVTLPLASPGRCAASAKPDPSVVATSSATCSTVLGPECDRIKGLDSQRVLRHEQLHFTIACLLARKGTRALALNPASEAQRILQDVQAKATDLSADTGRYDSETDHGCNASAQAAWETSVAAGLPLVKIS